MNWIFCNNCSKPKNSSTQEFYITACFHILCQTCIQNTCCVCKKPFRGILINDSMPYHVKYYFQNTKILIENLQKAIKFQTEQQRIYEIRNINVFSMMRKMNTIKCEIANKGNFMLQELKKESEKVENYKRKLTIIQTYKAKQEARQKFMEEYRHKKQNLNMSFDDHYGSNNAPSTSFGSRSLISSNLTLHSKNKPIEQQQHFSKSFPVRSDQRSLLLPSSVSNRFHPSHQQHHGKEFYVTPRKIYTQNVVQQTPQMMKLSSISTPKITNKCSQNSKRPSLSKFFDLL